MTTKYTDNFGLAMPDFREGPWHDLVNNDLRKIDGLLFSALSGAGVAVWLHSTIYAVGANALDDTDATIWMCVIPHTSAATGTFAADRAAHPTFWTRLLTGFAPRGEWVQNTQYFPYDLTYDSARGIMALCTIKHVSTAVGSIVTDKVYWAFLLDMSDVGTMTANAVSYSNIASGLSAANVQAAIDQVEVQVKALDTVNVNQGNQITAIQGVNTTQDTRLTALEGKTSFSGVVTAARFMSTDNGGTQFGGTPSVGYYNDGASTAIRAAGNGTIYFQNAGGGVTYGTTNASETVFHSGQFRNNHVICNQLSSAGNIYGSNTLNTANMFCNHTLYMNYPYNTRYLDWDGGNFVFGGAHVYSPAGRLLGTGDWVVYHDGSNNITSYQKIWANSGMYAHGYCIKGGLGQGYGGSFFNFDWGPPYMVGYIDYSGVGYLNPTSDYRVKKDIVSLPSMWDKVKNLHPIKYSLRNFSTAKWDIKEKGPMFRKDDTERWGFLAHELQERLTNTAALGKKDDPDNLQIPDPFTVIAALTKALQEAMERIEKLEAKL